MSVQVRADYPRLGPLFATAFDKAVRVTLHSWVWILAITLVCLGAASVGGASQAIDISVTIWSFAAIANAVRTFKPEYRMGGRTVVSVFLAGFLVGVSTLAGLVLLVWPGLYVATKWSMAQMAIVVDGGPVEAGLRRSWELTNGRFWRTFVFFVLLILAVEATVVIPGAAAIMAAGVLIELKLLRGTIAQAVEWVTALTSPIAMYAIQAQWIALLYWYQSLKAMADAELQPQPVAPPSIAGS